MRVKGEDDNGNRIIGILGADGDRRLWVVSGMGTVAEAQEDY